MEGSLLILEEFTGKDGDKIPGIIKAHVGFQHFHANAIACYSPTQTGISRKTAEYKVSICLTSPLIHDFSN